MSIGCKRTVLSVEGMVESAIQNNTTDILPEQFHMTTNEGLSEDNIFVCDETNAYRYEVPSACKSIIDDYASLVSSPK